MPEFFICAHTFAAPFVSDSFERFVEADTPEAALDAFAKDCEGDHVPLYSAVAYGSTDDYHRSRSPLARWLCNVAQESDKVGTGHSFAHHGIQADGRSLIEVDGEKRYVENPAGGSVVT